VLADGGAERFLQARGTMLRDASGARAGAVIVLNDVSRIKKLEQLRKEFVADVSHELKTPITSIQGYVETLMDGAMNDREEAGRFLAIVARHADRLNTIIEDLLLLSRLDQAPEAAKLEKDESSVAAVLATAVEACAMKSREKGISVLTDCPADLTALVNAQLLAQAVTNLLDNAVKYSESGASVTVSALREGGDFVVSVRDRGCGIPAELLPRIGERFFRVDKARSRGQGGTGLGLAIVKHIAEAHGGSLAVSSQVGKGSTFSIRLPLGSGPRDRRACPGRPEGGSGA
jgi:two-component system phosphate regulon sensor histidine kinase PhoR